MRLESGERRVRGVRTPETGRGSVRQRARQAVRGTALAPVYHRTHARRDSVFSACTVLSVVCACVSLTRRGQPSRSTPRVNRRGRRHAGPGTRCRRREESRNRVQTLLCYPGTA